MFVDTNVLVRARMPEAPEHVRALVWLEQALNGAERATISRQIIREYLAVVTRPQTWSDALPMEDALADAARLLDSFELLEDGPRVMERLLALCREVPVAGRQVHDANIVATMLEAGERRLLTFDVNDFRRCRPCGAGRAGLSVSGSWRRGWRRRARASRPPARR